MKFSEKKQNTYSSQIIENGGRIWVWFSYHGYRLLAVLFPNNCSLNLFISYRNEDKTPKQTLPNMKTNKIEMIKQIFGVILLPWLQAISAL